MHTRQLQASDKMLNIVLLVTQAFLLRATATVILRITNRNDYLSMKYKHKNHAHWPIRSSCILYNIKFNWHATIFYVISFKIENAFNYKLTITELVNLHRILVKSSSIKENYVSELLNVIYTLIFLFCFSYL